MGRDNDNSATQPEADVILKAGQQLGRPQREQGCKPYAIVGDQLVYLEPEEAAPLRFVSQKPKFREIGAFLDYVNRFKNADTRIFADERSGTITAVIDYHAANATPARCAHVATFTAEHSPEWKDWLAIDGDAQSQEKFAEFIENQAPFIVRPDAATMLEIASSFQATSSHSFSKAVRLDNGQVQLQYVENIDGRVGVKGQLDIPRDFDVQLRPFIGCSATRIGARFRYRLEQGRLSLWYDLFRADDVLRGAFDAMTKRVQDESQIYVYVGSAS